VIRPAPEVPAPLAGAEIAPPRPAQPRSPRRGRAAPEDRRGNGQRVVDGRRVQPRPRGVERHGHRCQGPRSGRVHLRAGRARRLPSGLSARALIAAVWPLSGRPRSCRLAASFPASAERRLSSAAPRCSTATTASAARSTAVPASIRRRSVAARRPAATNSRCSLVGCWSCPAHAPSRRSASASSFPRRSSPRRPTASRSVALRRPSSSRCDRLACACHARARAASRVWRRRQPSSAPSARQAVLRPRGDRSSGWRPGPRAAAGRHPPRPGARALARRAC